MSFRLVAKSVTLNYLERRNGVILRYFIEFGYLPGVLRKSSRSLSHLLMSSCYIHAITRGRLQLKGPVGVRWLAACKWSSLALFIRRLYIHFFVGFVYTATRIHLLAAVSMNRLMNGRR